MKASYVILFAIVTLAPVTGASAEDKPQLSPSGYVEIWPGTLPVVLSAPHGGTEKPTDIPDRPYGQKNLDGFTRPLAYAVRESFIKKYGEAPPLVVCLLARRKVDCNREIGEGAQGNAKAEKVWHEFQDGIKAAEKLVLEKNPHGLYLDIHAQGNPGSRVELGYAMTAEELGWPDEKLNAPEVAQRSTVRLLDEVSPTTFAELMRGPLSFGAMLEQRGVPATPSPQRPLKAGMAFFSGGYNVRAHGSADGKGLDGIQLETPITVRRTEEQRAHFAQAVVDAAEEYLLKHRGMRLGGEKPSK
jgi:hypothetical protein